MIDGSVYLRVHLDGEGLSGILRKQSGAWLKRNLGGGTFSAIQALRSQPSLFGHATGSEQLLDLSGDGQPHVIAFAGARYRPMVEAK